MRDHRFRLFSIREPALERGRIQGGSDCVLHQCNPDFLPFWPGAKGLVPNAPGYRRSAPGLSRLYRATSAFIPWRPKPTAPRAQDHHYLTRDYVWIMARTPEIPEADYRRIVEFVTQQGYDVTLLQKVPQRWAPRPPGAKG